MKLIGRLFLIVFLFIAASIVFGLGYMGYIPTIANLLGTNKPKISESDLPNRSALKLMQRAELSMAFSPPPLLMI